MRVLGRSLVGAVAATAAVLVASAAAGAAPTVVATQLDNPRGLTFGADGTLYVAEAGRGGAGPCFTNSAGDEVCLGATGAITQVRHGTQTRIATGLPSLAEEGGGGATGAHDVSVLGNGGVEFSIGMGAPPSRIAPGGVIAGSEWPPRTGSTGARGAGPRSLTSPRTRRRSTRTAPTSTRTPTAFSPCPDTHRNGRGCEQPAGRLRVRARSTVAAFPPRLTPLPFPPFALIPMDAVPTSVALGPDGALYVGQPDGLPVPRRGLDRLAHRRLRPRGVPDRLHERRRHHVRP